ncbi:hypothetical protein PR003_g22045 [Phytophthora rubi]|uniref:Uncharacterized protein n=1 Tax=Phytophthora rubi TaxID=129364 RepID=A0A6A3K3J4_9STRA|nr:hypothetical protein PR002_g21354 [Phytophthora rubi]KAE9000177.1 hypothetical protein PR001_g18854 [Phytophthora rubi]KAE9303295.1 hypothetical protein PR003_g22045 [Phytophthora rubi]
MSTAAQLSLALVVVVDLSNERRLQRVASPVQPRACDLRTPRAVCKQQAADCSARSNTRTSWASAL